jgi:hypothetical protein
MREDRLEVSVTFDSAKGYIASAPELARADEQTAQDAREAAAVS